MEQANRVGVRIRQHGCFDPNMVKDSRGCLA